jgi:hypothetical protein
MFINRKFIFGVLMFCCQARDLGAMGLGTWGQAVDRAPIRDNTHRIWHGEWIRRECATCCPPCAEYVQQTLPAGAAVSKVGALGGSDAAHAALFAERSEQMRALNAHRSQRAQPQQRTSETRM